MESLGIKLLHGRTSHYDRVLQYWRDAYQTATTKEGQQVYSDFVSSMFEIHDFVRIYQALKVRRSQCCYLGVREVNFPPEIFRITSEVKIPLKHGKAAKYLSDGLLVSNQREIYFRALRALTAVSTMWLLFVISF